MSAPRDIGYGVSVALVTTDGIVSGLEYHHPRADRSGEECGPSWIPFKGRPHGCDVLGWAVESEEPLTLSPSLLCRTCGHHGFIRGGRWVPA